MNPFKVVGAVVAALLAYTVAACLYILPWVILALVLHWLGAF